MSTTQKSASLPIDKFPLSILRIFAGLLVNVSIILKSFTDSLWYNSNASGNKVSTPLAPVAAWAKVSLLDSSSSGLWSETITSIRFLFRASTNDNLSSSVLKGGDNFTFRQIFIVYFFKFTLRWI